MRTARYPLAGGGDPPVFAVDVVSLWPRCNAGCSLERGYYYHPSRHSAGQPIVAGWAYQLIAQLGFLRRVGPLPVDAERVPLAPDANEVATEQMGAFVHCRFSEEEGENNIPCSSSTRATTPSSCRGGSRGTHARCT